MLPSPQSEGRPVTADVLLNLLQEEALLPTIKFVNTLAGINSVGRRADLLLLLKQKIHIVPQDRITIIVAETLNDLLTRHKKNSLLFAHNFDHMDPPVCIDTLQNAEAFIRQFEDELGTSLATYYQRLHEDDSKRWVSHAETDLFDDLFKRPRENHIDSRLMCFDPHTYEIVDQFLGPEVLRFCTEVKKLVSARNSAAPCRCIHCFLRSTFNKNQLVRVLQAFQVIPHNRQPYSFDISHEEYAAIQSGTLRAAIYLVDSDRGSFYMSEKRIRLWLNGVDVFFIQHDFSTLELDLKAAIRPGPNRLTLSDTSNSFFVVADLYRPLTCESCMQAVLEQSTSSVESDKAAFVSRMKEDEDGAALDTVCFQYSLLDPLTYQRMEHPVRSSACTHLNCFDLKGFLQMYLGKAKMPCPVCSSPLRLDDLVQDAFVLSILSETSPEEEEVEMRQDGEWSHCPVRPELSDEPEPEPPAPRRVERPLPKPAPARSRRTPGGPSIESFFRSKRFSMSTVSSRALGGAGNGEVGAAGSGEVGAAGSGEVGAAGSGEADADSSIIQSSSSSSMQSPSSSSMQSSNSSSMQSSNSPSMQSSNSSSMQSSNSSNMQSSNSSSIQSPNIQSSTNTPSTTNQPTSDEMLSTLLSLLHSAQPTKTPSQPDIIDLCDDSSDEQPCTIINLSDSLSVSFDYPNKNSIPLNAIK